MKTKTLTFFICIGTAILIAGPAVAQGRFAFIDSEKIQSNYKEWSKAQEQFNTELRAWEEEASKMQQELNDMMREYDQQRLILSAEKKAEKEAQISAKEEALRSFTREISGPGGKADSRMEQLVRPLYEKITAAVEKVAIEENYDFVFNSEGLVYGRKELDITDKVIDVLESGE
jgi:outer membrane protein